MIDDSILGGACERRLADQGIGRMTGFGAGLYYEFSDVASSSDNKNLEILSHWSKVSGEEMADRRTTVELQKERRKRWESSFVVV